jgi:ribonuclease III
LLLSSAFEAVVGAIALDQGLDVATSFLERFLVPEIREIVAERRHENFKSLLQEYTQAALAVTPEYRTVRMSGPSHSRAFTVEVVVGDDVAGQGEGPNKRTAQQAAAREALKHLKES